MAKGNQLAGVEETKETKEAKDDEKGTIQGERMRLEVGTFLWGRMHGGLPYEVMSLEVSLA